MSEYNNKFALKSIDRRRMLKSIGIAGGFGTFSSSSAAAANGPNFQSALSWEIQDAVDSAIDITVDSIADELSDGGFLPGIPSPFATGPYARSQSMDPRVRRRLRAESTNPQALPQSIGGITDAIRDVLVSSLGSVGVGSGLPVDLCIDPSIPGFGGAVNKICVSHFLSGYESAVEAWNRNPGSAAEALIPTFDCLGAGGEVAAIPLGFSVAGNDGGINFNSGWIGVDVETACVFVGYNGPENLLDAPGIRLFGPNPWENQPDNCKKITCPGNGGFFVDAFSDAQEIAEAGLSAAAELFDDLKDGIIGGFYSSLNILEKYILQLALFVAFVIVAAILIALDFSTGPIPTTALIAALGAPVLAKTGADKHINEYSFY